MSILMVGTDTRSRVWLVHTARIGDVVSHIARSVPLPGVREGSGTQPWSRLRLGWEAASHDLPSLLSVSDMLVTVGWPALQALERNDALSDLHVVTSLDAHLVAGRIGSRPPRRGAARPGHNDCVVKEC